MADYLSRIARAEGKDPLTMHDVLTAMIKAHEIQGILALENSYNRVGLDHVLLVRVATTAVVTRLLGGDRDTVINAISHAWIVERLKTAGKAVHQTVMRRLEGELAVDSRIADVIRNIDQYLVRLRSCGRADVV